eukprot:761911-Hanusia_phi.AAC.3
MAKNVLFANSAADFNLTVLTHHGMLDYTGRKMGSRAGGVLAQVSDSLKLLKIEELKKLMEDPEAFDVYFEKNIPIVKEKQELIRAIKDSNIASAKKNMDLQTSMESLSRQVEELRQLVQDRQLVLRPKFDEIKMFAAVRNSPCEVRMLRKYGRRTQQRLQRSNWTKLQR